MRLTAPLFIAAITIISGCTTVKVKPLDASNHKITKICIAAKYDYSAYDMINIIEEAFKRHNISTETHGSAVPSDCLYKLTYSAERSWDVVSYLKNADIQVQYGKEIVASANYHNGGGFDFGKWGSTDSKINPLLDEMLQNCR